MLPKLENNWQNFNHFTEFDIFFKQQLLSNRFSAASCCTSRSTYQPTEKYEGDSTKWLQRKKERHLADPWSEVSLRTYTTAQLTKCWKDYWLFRPDGSSYIYLLINVEQLTPTTTWIWNENIIEKENYIDEK